MKRVLYVGSFNGEHHSDNHIADAMAAAGWLVVRFLREDFKQLPKGFGEDYHLLFCGKPKSESWGAAVTPEDLARVRCPTVALWWGDTHDNDGELLSPFAKVVHLLLTTNADYVEQFSKAGFRSAAFWPLAAPPPYHPVTLAGPDAAAYACQVLFIGNFYTEDNSGPLRTALLEAVGKQFDTRVYGAGWDHLRLARPMGPAVTADSVKALAGAKLALCLTTGARTLLQSNRIWTHMACGKCCLNQYIPGLERLFTDGIHQIFWRKEMQLLRLIDRLLRQDDERERIGLGARQYIEQRHTFAHRVRTLALYLKGRREETPWETVHFRA